jgi:hypothetical protein
MGRKKTVGIAQSDLCMVRIRASAKSRLRSFPLLESSALPIRMTIWFSNRMSFLVEYTRRRDSLARASDS